MATFRTRARTLDMLGRQQIAGIPTAISELFKNAHDAYADNVEIDYFRSDGLFVLRDDGVGMNKEDFETRWLTIGTESKFVSTRLPPHFPNKEKRPMLGEKGIGRLAVATIGPQLLVLSRAVGASDLITSFLNWSIFEWPGIDLEDINIPLRTISSGGLPTDKDVAEMVEEFRISAKTICHKVDHKLFNKLEIELDQFDIDPQDIDSYLKEPTLNKNRNGTHFIIKPTTPLLDEDIDGDPTGRKTFAVTSLKKALLGFSNTMTPDSRTVIKTAFRDYKTDELYDDLISGDEFFTPEEFKGADHRISGNFDPYGQFRGEISIFGETIPDHVITWSGNPGVHTKCGPFKIDFAAFEGEARHSTIPNEEHARIKIKAEQLGGLYIYRNGIRILPYGNTDFDWLDIEINRSKSAYYYYFSHRKMFGTIEIDADKNSLLVEKAGREGFQENKAYRQFRSILRNFFTQMAADFFRTEGLHSDIFDLKKTELSREHKARLAREKHIKERRKNFEEKLNDFFEKLNTDKPQEEVLALTERAETQLRITRSLTDKQLAAKKILELERVFQSEIRDLEETYLITRPRIPLRDMTLRDWGAYTSAFSTLHENVFSPARSIFEELIEEEVQKASISLNRQVRTEAALDGLGKQVQIKTKYSGNEVKKKATEVASNAREVASQSLKAVELEFREVMSDFQKMDLASLTDEGFIETRDKLETRILRVTEEKGELLRSIKEQLDAIEVNSNISTIEQLGAIEQRNLLLEEQAEADAQLAQLGMAIEIIDHEFSGTIRSIRTSLRKLKAWADINQGLEELYNNIRKSFDHLDGYLTLFTPLQRRLYRKEVEIHGYKIFAFLEELFRARLARHNISLTATKAFSSSRVLGYPSSFYPVFVNLVDNAIFWLSQQNPHQERKITLDENNGTLIVADTGPGVGIRDLDTIFEFGFSRKPGGRGMGLHIGRETLRRVGYDLYLIDGSGGAKFGLIPKAES